MKKKSANSAKLSASVRFEVLKRDAFTCQYCGRRPPDVMLHVDHIEPVAEGGSAEVLNLVTACSDCNLGKSDRRLSDQSPLAKQVEQAAVLSEKREQIEMLAKWKRGLKQQGEQVFAIVRDWWLECIDYQASLTETGADLLRKSIRKFGEQEIMDSIEEATRVYLRRDERGRIDHESIKVAFSKINGFAWTRRASLQKPWFPQILYIRGIIRNRFDITQVEAARLLQTLDRAVERHPSMDLDNLKELAIQAGTIYEFLDGLGRALDRLNQEDGDGGQS